MSKERAVLVVEDNDIDREAVRRAIGENLSISEVSTLREALKHCESAAPGCVLLDLGLPDSEGLDAIEKIHGKFPDIPIVVLTGLDDEELGHRALELGAQDYLAKSQLGPALLVRTVRYAIDRQRAMKRLQHSELRWRTAFEKAPIGMMLLDEELRILGTNEALACLLGETSVDVESRYCPEFVPEERREDLKRGLNELFTGRTRTLELVQQFSHPDGRPRWGKVTAVIVERDPSVALGMVEDITSRRQAEREQKRSLRILEATPDLIGLYTPDLQTLDLNRAGCRLLRLGPGHEVTSLSLLDILSSESRRLIQETALPTAVEEGAWSGESVLLARDGSEIPISQVILAHKSQTGELEFISTIARDIRELKELELRSRQSQKMEAVGALAGGIAHDFNNVLTASLGYTELALHELGEDHPLRSDLEEVQKAGRRAEALTRQLLAFSRRQVMQPKVIVLSEIIDDLLKMLRRVIGEHIELGSETSPDVWPVKADPGQIEQVIVNLAVNARDAMPSGGSLTIRTENVEDVSRYRYPMEPGPYVLLTVSDTGHGMDEGTKARVFEPFFTTKAQGKGTGLGLATVYGIVKQSHGYIWAKSEPGRGTSFEIFLPRHGQADEVHSPPKSDTAKPHPTGRSGTVLIVEDDVQVRSFARRFLEGRGYNVLVAEDGSEGLEICKSYSGRIDLLVTDVILPGMTGPSVAEQLTATRPEMNVLFVSGYMESALVERIQESGAAFLKKPFTATSLLKAVETALSPEGEPRRSVEARARNSIS